MTPITTREQFVSPSTLTDSERANMSLPELRRSRRGLTARIRDCEERMGALKGAEADTRRAIRERTAPE